MNREIVFFDGVCGLCNMTVDLVLRQDRDHRFVFAPLQGETFQQILRIHPELSQQDSIFVLRENQQPTIISASTAAVYILGKLPAFRWFARILQPIPAPLLDAGYWFIARIRYRIWGKRDEVRRPTAEEQDRFLP